MALQGARTIMVKGKNYNWKFTHAAVRIRGDAPAVGTITVQGKSLHGKLQATVVTQTVVDEYTAEHGGHRASVTPADVRLVIEAATAAGWDPEVRGLYVFRGPLKLGQYQVAG